MPQIDPVSMNSLLADDDELDRDDRELTLSTGAILGIFFGFVLVCGLFFGFGYKMGSHKAPSAEAATAENSPTPAANFAGFKPAAGSSEGDSAAVSAKSVDPDPAGTPAAADSSGNAATTAADAPVVRDNPTGSDRTTSPVDPASESPVTAGSFVVQVAAVSHQEDAELLVNALRTRGYPVSAHTEPQDKFFHIQVGPFNNRKDTDAAKQRLLADGYQPIVK
jgi:cell division septation protein DedD